TMWMIELATNTITADNRIGIHSAVSATISGLLGFRKGMSSARMVTCAHFCPQSTPVKSCSYSLVSRLYRFISHLTRELIALPFKRADQRMGRVRLSLLVAIERAAPGLDALDPQALQVKPEDRETTALDQSAADGPTTGGPEEPTEAADLRAHQAGLSAEAS